MGLTQYMAAVHPIPPSFTLSTALDFTRVPYLGYYLLQLKYNTVHHSYLAIASSLDTQYNGDLLE